MVMVVVVVVVVVGYQIMCFIYKRGGKGKFEHGIPRFATAPPPPLLWLFFLIGIVFGMMLKTEQTYLMTRFE
jgi:energy-coupling factor transporter transmembrane protein EcfT